MYIWTWLFYPAVTNNGLRLPGERRKKKIYLYSRRNSSSDDSERMKQVAWKDYGLSITDARALLSPSRQAHAC